MMNAIGSVINQIDSLVWGWWMIILLLGTHIFMTIRTGVIQRKIGTAIRLSVTKDTNAEGEVSQFGALTTALASTIGTGNIIGVGTAIALAVPVQSSGAGLPVSSESPPNTVSLSSL